MAIPLSRYVEITSAVGAGTSVATRELILRLITENALVPTNTVLEFNTLADVGIYFGTSSTEYARASFYFGWVNKLATSPQKISYTRWADVDVASTIYGKVANYSVSSFSSVTTGDFTLTLGGFTHHLTGIDLSAAGSLSAVATAIQTAVRAYSAGGTAWTSADVTYDVTRKSFNLVSGTEGDDTVAVTAGVVTDIASLIGWLTGAIFSNGQDAQTITEMLDYTTNLTNNFGSFAFIPALTLDEVTEAAEWNLAQNNMFIYTVPVSAANASAWNAALSDIGGTTLTLSSTAGEYPEQVPAMILAATDYTGTNTVQNYMFQIFNLTPSVTTNTDANTYDDLNINYYGQTQTAGTLLSFYQTGVMFGTSTQPLDQNTYANEIWLKDAIGAALMTLQLAQTQLPANNQGVSMTRGVIQNIVLQAVNNGTISIGKPLTDTQKSYVTNLTGDNLAWQQVQNIGYWLGVNVVPYTEDNVQKFKMVYTLIYSKDDIIRKIEGSDILI